MVLCLPLPGTLYGFKPAEVAIVLFASYRIGQERKEPSAAACTIKAISVNIRTLPVVLEC